MNGNLSYNANDLQTFDPLTRVGINTNVINHTDAPNSYGDVVAIANASDSVVPTNEYPNRLIKLGGTIHGSSQSDLDSRIDTFKGYFVARNKNLDVEYAGTTRRYEVMKANTVGIERQNKALFATFTVELLCKPFGRETTPTEILSLTGNTSASVTVEPTIGGNAPFQLPIVTIELATITGEGDFIQIANDLKGQTIIVTGQQLADGDVLVVNSEERTVTVDDVSVDYSGAFLELEPGPQAMTITDGFDTRIDDIRIEYFKRFM